MRRNSIWLLPLVSLAACAAPVGLESGDLPSTGGTQSSPGGGGSKAGAGGSTGGSAANVSGGASAGGSGGTGGASPSGGTGANTGGGGFDSGAGAGSGGGGSGGAGSGGAASGGGGASAGAGGSGATAGVGGGAACLAPVPGGLCNPVAQCGCSSLQNCDVAGPSGFTSCFPAGPKLAYQSCLTQTECSKGTSCVSYGCKPFCQVDADCPLTGSKCVQVYMGAPVPGWRSCVASCALENPAARCGPGTTCAVVLPDTTDCVGGAGSGIGPGTCGPGNELACAPGHACRTDGSCAKWCRVGASDCPAGIDCNVTPLTVTVGAVVYGTCGA